MRTPISKTYPLTGGTAYVGKVRPASGMPAWVPAPGVLKSIHLNDLSTLNPCPGNNCWYTEADGQNGPWSLWTGSVFASDYGPYGAMVNAGGGHGGYDGTELYISEITANGVMHKRLNDPVPFNFLSQVDTAWSDFLYEGNYVVPATHTYSHPTYLSPLNGGGVKGSWCLPFNVYENTGGLQPHAVDLDTGVSTRLTTNTLSLSGGGSGPYGGSFVDKRGVLWAMPNQNATQHGKIDLRQTPKTLVAANGFSAPGYYFIPVYVESKDMMMGFYCNYGQTTPRADGFDLSSGTPVAFPLPITVTGTVPTVRGPGFGCDWCPETGKFYCYEGVGDTTLFVLTPPAGDWKTGAWTWSTEVMGGEAPVNINVARPNGTGGNPFTKWKYNPAIKCFMWMQGLDQRLSPDGVMRKGAFQVYKPLGIA
jgi:hypothetical protein